MDGSFRIAEPQGPAGKPPRRPWLQGDLDSLCGAYCVVNAVRYLAGTPSSREASAELLQAIVTVWQPRRCLTERLLGGSDNRDIAKALKQIVGPRYAIQHRQPYRSAQGLTLDGYWQALQTFLAQERRLVILRINGPHNHWTLVSQATPRALRLYDSVQLKYLRRRHCDLNGSRDATRTHWLYPSHTHFLWVD